MKNALHCFMEIAQYYTFEIGFDIHSAVAKEVFSLPCEISEVRKLYPNERNESKMSMYKALYSRGME